EIRGVLDQQRIVFPWLTGDVLMLDNMLTAHARDPFEGPRKVVVAMAQSYSEGHGKDAGSDWIEGGQRMAAP
ncbi:TauD/TfdA family dioxygenase, partial [Klebsiella pneumoniae]|nr:TauD/TfdA family dioxygenase [Klebsiella pneumoniae]